MQGILKAPDWPYWEWKTVKHAEAVLHESKGKEGGVQTTQKASTSCSPLIESTTSDTHCKPTPEVIYRRQLLDDKIPKEIIQLSRTSDASKRCNNQEFDVSKRKDSANDIPLRGQCSENVLKHAAQGGTEVISNLVGDIRDATINNTGGTLIYVPKEGSTSEATSSNAEGSIRDATTGNAEGSIRDAALGSPHLHGIDIAVPQTSSLSKLLLQNFTSVSNIFEDKINKEILHEVNEIMMCTINKLAKSNELFKNCRLLPAGSVAEGTKVGRADEFDFLIALDTFLDREKWKLLVEKGYFQLVCTDKEMCSAIIANDPEILLCESKMAVLNPSIRQNLMAQFVNKFDECINSRGTWQRVRNDEKELCVSDIAATMHLVSCTYGIDVDVDVCMCIPVDIYSVDNILKCSRDEDTLALFSYLKSLHSAAPFEIFAIIGEDAVIWKATTTRITAPLLELSRFQFYGPTSSRVLTYRLAKCIVSSFLPKLTKIAGCKRCCHPLVRSYHLKNIIFFMMKMYTNDSHWADDMIPTRVCEVFSILKHCIVGKLDEIANIATCCIPGTLRVDDISTFNPFLDGDHQSARNHDFFFTQDSHKPMFELSVSPEYKDDILKTGCSLADVQIVDWFEHLNKEHWSSYQLLQELSELLINLSRC